MGTFDVDDVRVDGGDDGWRFDPANPPDTFTRKMLGRMSIGEIKRLADPANGVLNEKQQASFDAAYEELGEEMREMIRPLAAATLAAVRPTLPTIKFHTPFSAQLERIRSEVAGQVKASESLGVQLPSVAHSFEATHPLAIRPSVTADQLVDRVQTTREDLDLLQAIFDLIRRQQDLGARGMTFYVVVGLATTTAGMASLVSMADWGERIWTISLTVGAGLVALLGYWLSRRRQSATDSDSAMSTADRD